MQSVCGATLLCPLTAKDVMDASKDAQAPFEISRPSLPCLILYLIAKLRCFKYTD